MAETFTLDRLVAGRILLTKEPGEPAVITLEYEVQDAGGQFRRIKVHVPPLSSVSGVAANATYQQIADLLWNAAVARARQVEGL